MDAMTLWMYSFAVIRVMVYLCVLISVMREKPN